MIYKPTKPSERKTKVKVENDVWVLVESIGIVMLILNTSYELILKNVYVYSFKRNLIFVSFLDRLRYKFEFDNYRVKLILNFQLIGNKI